MTPTGINISDGSFTYTTTDISIGTLNLERFYLNNPTSPIDPNTMYFGPSSSHNFDVFVTPVFIPAVIGPPHGTPQHPQPIVHMGTSIGGTYHQEDFLTSGIMAPENGESERGSLSYSTSTLDYTYVDQAGTIYQFNHAVPVAGVQGAGIYAPYAQRIGSITYPDGRVRSFTYVSGLLKVVSDSTGYAIVFDYTGSYVSAACGFNLAQTYVDGTSTCSGAIHKTTYGYSGILTSSMDVLQRQTTYSIVAGSGGNNAYCITPPGYSTCKIKNDYSVANELTQTLADGFQWVVRWANVLQRDSEYVPEPGDNHTIVTDPAHVVFDYTFTGTSPETATDSRGKITTYKFEGGINLSNQPANPPPYGSLLVEVGYPEGNKYQAENLGPFRALSKQRLVAKNGTYTILVRYEYTCSSNVPTPTCTKPTARIDGRGNQTDYSYYSFGGIQSEMQPAPVAGAARPLKLYTYVGKSAYAKTSPTTFGNPWGPIQLPASETDCQTVAGSGVNAPVCDTSSSTAAPIVVTTYEYRPDTMPDNLLLRGKVVSTTIGGSTVSLRTCYTYDSQGNRVSETSPLGTTALSSCP